MTSIQKTSARVGIVVLVLSAGLMGCSRSSPRHASSVLHKRSNKSTTSTTSKQTKSPSTSGPTSASFPTLILEGLQKLGKLPFQVLAPTQVPIPSGDSGKYLGATVGSSTTSYSFNFSLTSSQLALNDPTLSDPSYLPGGANFLGSFSESTGNTGASISSQLSTLASELDSTCRSQLVATTIAPTISGQSCANGTGNTLIWSEGNWRIGVVASNSLGPADTALAGQIASFLSDHFLPPPTGIGVIKAQATGGQNVVDSAPGSSSTPTTSIEITYSQLGALVQINDSLDAIGGLEMAVSVRSYNTQ